MTVIFRVEMESDAAVAKPRTGGSSAPAGYRIAHLALAAILAIVSTSFAEDGASSSPTEKPADAAAAMQVLKSRCFSCHNEEKAKGGLVMTSHEKLMKGGESGAAVVTGEPEKSPLLTSLAADADPHMPPKKQLQPEEIAVLANWIKAGAAWNADALIDKPRTVALAPLPATYQPVLTMALSPDGKKLAAGCGNEVLIYDVREKDLAIASRASAHPDPVQTVAWSADGTRLATGAFRRVVVWNAQELSAERVIREGLTDRISSVRFAPPGNTQLVIADGRIGENGTVRLADANAGTIAASWTAHGDTIFDMALSPDGKFLATAGGDKLVKIWDVSTQKETARIESHATQVLSVAFNTDGTQLITAGADQQLKGWDMKTRDQVMLIGRHTSAINAVAWAATGPTLFAATDAGGLLRYTDFKPHSGAQSSDSASERKFEAADVALYCLAATGNAERIFAGTHDGRILGWNKDGKMTVQMQGKEPKPTVATK